MAKLALDMLLDANDPEVGRQVTINAIKVDNNLSRARQLIGYFCHWRHLKTTPKATPKAIVTSGSCILTVDELSEAEMAMIRYCQQLRFSEEIPHAKQK